MTSVTSATAATGAAPTTASANSATTRLDPNAFLKLLVAELQNQDPTKPMDTTQLVQQLASMSQVEQAAQTNARLASIIDQLSLGQSSSLIGRTAISADGTQTGAITAITTTDSGMQATLVDGSRLMLGQGVTISQ